MTNPPLIVPHKISRSFIQQHPDWIFVYSFDVVGKSFFGQANAAHGEPNAYPVPVLYKYCASGRVCFEDSRSDEQWPYVQKALDSIPLDKGPIIPFRRMGLGCGRMKEFAPKMYKKMWEELDKIAYKNIEWRYRL